MDLVRKTRQTIHEEKLMLAGDTVICGVSGGPDSMALLHVLLQVASELKFRVVAAHVNHQFRGAEAEREAELVCEFAALHGVMLERAEIDVPAYIRAHGGNAQAVARELRYEFLRETADKHGAARLALAHHADDQAETVLMHLLRGSALSGLSGMPLKRMDKNVELIRPFLRIYKSELVAYCEDQEIPYAIDSSNEQRKYTRNRIRLDVMPFLLDVNPQLPQAINRLADVIRDEESYLEQQTRLAADRIVHFAERECSVSREHFIVEPVALQRRMIKLILNHVAKDALFLDFTKIESIRSAIISEAPPSLYLDVGAFVRMRRTYDQIVLSAIRDNRSQDAEYEYRIENPIGEMVIPSIPALLSFHMEQRAEGQSPEDSNEVLFDADFVSFPLTIRNRKDGDRIHPYGLNGSKKVKDMFIDLKIHPDWRDRVPLIEDATGRILWIAGIRRSRHAPVGRSTTRVMRIRFVVERSATVVHP